MGYNLMRRGCMVGIGVDLLKRKEKTNGLLTDHRKITKILYVTNLSLHTSAMRGHRWRTRDGIS